MCRGHAWQELGYGACMAGGMHTRGHSYRGVCVVGHMYGEGVHGTLCETIS